MTPWSSSGVQVKGTRARVYGLGNWFVPCVWDDHSCHMRTIANARRGIIPLSLAGYHHYAGSWLHTAQAPPPPLPLNFRLEPLPPIPLPKIAVTANPLPKFPRQGEGMASGTTSGTGLARPSALAGARGAAIDVSVGEKGETPVAGGTAEDKQQRLAGERLRRAEGLRRHGRPRVRQAQP